jgi:hypothetical protein
VKVEVTVACLSVERSVIRPEPNGLPLTVPACTLDSRLGLAVRTSSPDALSVRVLAFAATAWGAAATPAAATAASEAMPSRVRRGRPGGVVTWLMREHVRDS